MFNRIIAEIKAFFAPVESDLEISIREQKEVKEIADFLIANEGKFKQPKKDYKLETYITVGLLVISLSSIIGAGIYISKPSQSNQPTQEACQDFDCF